MFKHDVSLRIAKRNRLSLLAVSAGSLKIIKKTNLKKLNHLASFSANCIIILFYAL